MSLIPGNRYQSLLTLLVYEYVGDDQDGGLLFRAEDGAEHALFRSEAPTLWRPALLSDVEILREVADTQEAIYDDDDLYWGDEDFFTEALYYSLLDYALRLKGGE